MTGAEGGSLGLDIRRQHIQEMNPFIVTSLPLQVSDSCGGGLTGVTAFIVRSHRKRKEENDPGSHSLCIGSQADKEGKEE